MPSLRTRITRAFSAFSSDEVATETLRPTQVSRGCYILEFKKSPDKLLNEPQAPLDVVKKYIGLDRPIQSVFQASNDIEEVEALAALLVCRTNVGGPERCYGIRLLENDFVGLAIEVKSTPTEGDTGVMRVDRRHFDLTATVEAYTELMRRMLERSYAGEHRVRQAGIHQIGLMIRTFSSLNGAEIIREKKLRCDNIMKNYNF